MIKSRKIAYKQGKVNLFFSFREEKEIFLLYLTWTFTYTKLRLPAVEHPHAGSSLRRNGLFGN